MFRCDAQQARARRWSDSGPHRRQVSELALPRHKVAPNGREVVPSLAHWASAAKCGPGTVRAMTIPTDPDATEPVELSILNEDWRLRPVDPRHVELLAAALDRCPPIVVRRTGRVLLDGHARVAAARLKGQTTLRAAWFTGSDAEAFEAAISANAQHGLPLTGPERIAALHALLELAPQWSNRRLAVAAGLSEATVRRARRPGASRTHLDGDVLGADGKRYPRDAAIRRATAMGLIRSRPEMSNRAIARLVGLSPTTVGKLRIPTNTQPEAPTAPDATTPAQNDSRTHGWAAWWTRIIGWLRRWANRDKAKRAAGVRR